MKKVGVVMSFFFISCNSTNHDNYRITEINNGTEKIYLKEVTWGISSDNKRIYIGTSDEIEDTLNEMFYNDYYFFYKIENDTLTTYTMSASRHKERLSSQIKHKEIVLSNSDMMDLTQTYEMKGLKELVWNH